MRDSTTLHPLGAEEPPPRVGLVVVHGIGEQKPGATVRSVVEGLEQAYGEDSFVAGCHHREGGGRGSVYYTMPARTAGPSTTPVTPEVKVYEAHWAEVLSGASVAHSFHIRQLQQFIWFPLLNRRHVENFAHDYPAWRVYLWTAVLAVLGSVLTAAYYAAVFILDRFQSWFERPRESDILVRLAMQLGAESWMRRVLDILQKEPPEGARRNPVDRLLDTHVGDIFNYIHSAGEAGAAVPEAEEKIQGVFRHALELAARDGCSEVQVLAHSLGSVAVYRALTRFREETERLISLDEPDAGRPQLTRLYTIGSPLEKIRFFWPKLMATAGEQRPPLSLRWDNFRNKGDPVAGVLRTFDIVPQVENHSVAGAGGLVTAHTGYRSHPSFLRVFGPAVTGRSPSTLKSKWYKPGRRLSALLELIGVPAGLVLLALLGVAAMYVQGAILGWLLSLGLSPALGWLLGPESVAPELVGEWLPRALGVVVPAILVIAALPLGYLHGKWAHEEHWRNGFQLERRTTMPSRQVTETKEPATAPRKSPYRKPGSYPVLIANIAILALLGWVGLNTGPGDRFTRPGAGLLILLLMVAFAVFAGRGITGYWRGILIDQRNKMSLSRLQLLAWTLLILSTLLTVVLTNISLGSDSPLVIDIPSELWVLLGITTASAVGGPAVLSTKRKKAANATEMARTKEELTKDTTVEVDDKRSTMVIYNRHPEDARWGDLLKGDESGNAATVDLGKLQMFFFTFVLVLGYGAAIATLLEGTTLISTLPPIDDSMNTLLGISHTGYLANKTVSHSQEAETPGEGAEK